MRNEVHVTYNPVTYKLNQIAFNLVTAMVNPDVTNCNGSSSNSSGSDDNLGSNKVQCPEPASPCALAKTNQILVQQSPSSANNDMAAYKRKADDAFAALLLEKSENARLVYDGCMAELEKAKLVPQLKLSDQGVTENVTPTSVVHNNFNLTVATSSLPKTLFGNL
jgi:hypothetical protein